MIDKRQRLFTVLNEEATTLHNIIRSYVVKMGLAQGATADEHTSEIINETVVAALQHLDRYDAQRRMLPWLLGIAINRIRRCLAQRGQAQQREIAVRDLYPGTQAQHSDDELFNRFAQWVTDASTLESEQAVADLLAPLSPSDREILHLAILQELDAPTIARQLAISPTAVRVRIHRALKRLRGHYHLNEARTDHEPS